MFVTTYVIVDPIGHHVLYCFRKIRIFIVRSGKGTLKLYAEYLKYHQNYHSFVGEKFTQ